MTTLAPVTRELCESLWRQTCAWGRWGRSDQAGTLNLIDANKRREAAALVREGVSIGLGNAWPVAPGPHNPWPAEHRMIRAGDDHLYPGVPGLSVAMDYIGVQPHGVACAHIDALCHVFVNARMYNGYPASEVKSTGSRRNDVMTMADGLVTRGVLLDLPRTAGVDHLDGFGRVGPDELEAAERAGGVTVARGDVLIVHKGRERRLTEVGAIDPAVDGMPGLHPACVPWLAERGVAVLGSDYMNDPQPNWDCADWPIPVHYLVICGMGMPLMHNLDTAVLAETCQRLGRWSFLIAIAPLKVPGGTGAPVNPLAVF